MMFLKKSSLNQSHAVQPKKSCGAASKQKYAKIGPCRLMTVNANMYRKISIVIPFYNKARLDQTVKCHLV